MALSAKIPMKYRMSFLGSAGLPLLLLLAEVSITLANRMGVIFIFCFGWTHDGSVFRTESGREVMR